MQEEIIVENGIKSILQKIFDYYYSYKRTCKTVALGELIGVVSESKNGLMSSNGFISRTGIIIPSGGTILDAMTNNMKDGIYQVTGISASDPMKDWGVLIIVGAKFAIFKPLNIRNYVITITRQATTSDWNTPYKFIGNL